MYLFLLLKSMISSQNIIKGRLDVRLVAKKLKKIQKTITINIFYINKYF